MFLARLLESLKKEQRSTIEIKTNDIEKNQPQTLLL